MKLYPDYLRRKGYRLPTEAEWEYVCRAGTVTSWSFGATEELLGEYAWYLKNSDDRSQPIGSKKPNDFGLFDMNGNQIEWCQERIRNYSPGPNGQPSEDVEDTADVIASVRRVLRGGAFNDLRMDTRSADRLRYPPTYGELNVGFRVAQTRETFD